MYELSRRGLLKLGLGTAVSALAGQLTTAQGQTPTGTLRVATWGGSWRDSLEKNISSKLAAKGIKVQYVLGNPDDNIAKLVAAKRQGIVPFDLIEFTSAEQTLLASGGFLEKIDFDRIPNAKAVPAWARADAFVVPQFTPDGIIYNTDRLKQAKVAVPQHYFDLQDPKFKDYLGFPSPSNVAHWDTVIGMAYEKGGDERNMQPALQTLGKLNPSYLYAASTDLALKFGSGDIWIAPWQTSWAVRLAKSGEPIAAVYPQIGAHRGALLPTPIGIVKGSQNEALAHAFINEYLSEEAQYAHGLATGEVPINSQARQQMQNDPVLKSMMLLSDAQVDNAFRIDWTKFNEQSWRDKWSRGVTQS
jgi:putative spermidine/putrescine transport system substrate-binding protein